MATIRVFCGHTNSREGIDMARPPVQDRRQVLGRLIRIRVTQDEKARWEEAARRQGYPSLSRWLRYVADRAARMG